MSSLPTELWKWDAVDVAAGVRAGTVSAREVTEAVLARIEAVNPKLNAVVDVLTEEALAAADAADRAVRSGQPLGVMHGVPVTTKLNADQAGTSNSSGVEAFKDRIADADNPAIENLRRAGAIIVGRTNTPPFCLRWMTENDVYGRTYNPWSKEHVPGGSTGGGSSALAAGMGAIAQGSDNGGSVRYPAFCTGVTGLRPTPGRIPYYNPSQFERPLSMQLIAVPGPLARRVADLRIGFEAMVAPDPRDPFHIPMPVSNAPPPRPLKVAISLDPTGDGVEPSVAKALERTAEILTDAGFQVATPKMPDIVEAAELWDEICQGEGGMVFAEMVSKLADQPMKEAMGFMMARMPSFEPGEYHALYTKRATLMRQWSMFLAEYPILITPVSTRAQFIHGEDIWSQEANDLSYRVQSTLTAFALIGLPGVSVPTGVEDGLPTGVLVMAPRFREDLALGVAEIIEANCPMDTPIDPRF
ncbi:amidase [Amorphus sp. 3PC139-8]|uniref:amidase n=1 Tax=Amorphus sp. 3PC139-8 TaxID=2735676 RepID=UPI00345D5B41